jgi:ABC-type amino acid transport substrate-binding protein
MNRVLLSLVALVVTLILCISSAWICTAAGNLDLNQSIPVFRAGIIARDNFPFIYEGKHGQWQGFEIELLKKLQHDLGIDQLQLWTYPDHQALVTALLENKVDCGVSKFIINLKDAEKLLFSQPYMRLDTVFLVNRKLRAELGMQDKPLTISPLPKENPWQQDGIVFGTTENQDYAALLECNFPGNTIVRIQDPVELISRVAAGTLFACYVDEAQAKTYFQCHPEQGLAVAYLPALPDSASIALAFSWQNESLREWSNIFLQRLGFPAADLDELIRAE